MILFCVECNKRYDIPDDKMDDYNIYRKWNGVGSVVTCEPRLLCRKCTDTFVAIADAKILAGKQV